MKQILVSEKLLRQVLDYVEKGNPGHIADRINVLVKLRNALEHPAVEPVADLVDYILQDDTNNRLTPRVVDIAYSTFVIAKQGKNTDDGGPCDWFNDTLPMVMKQLAKIKKDLAENAALARESAPQAQQPRKAESKEVSSLRAVKLSEEDIDVAWRSVDYTQPYARFRFDIGRAIEAAVLTKNGVTE